MLSIGHLRQSAAWITIPLLLAWLVLDLRWQVNLISNTLQIVPTFRSIEHERALTQQDISLLDFLDSLPFQTQLDTNNRIFMFSRHEFWRTRARYHLAPLPVRTRSDERWNGEFSQSVRPGDVILLMEAPSIEAAETDIENIFKLHATDRPDIHTVTERWYSQGDFSAYQVISER
jgi:hypothetical protein